MTDPNMSEDDVSWLERRVAALRERTQDYRTGIADAQAACLRTGHASSLDLTSWLDGWFLLGLSLSPLVISGLCVLCVLIGEGR